LQIFDLTGRIVYKKELIDSPEIISLNQLKPGLYIYQLLERSKLVKAGKIVITD